MLSPAMRLAVHIRLARPRCWGYPVRPGTTASSYRQDTQVLSPRHYRSRHCVQLRTLQPGAKTDRN